MNDAKHWKECKKKILPAFGEKWVLVTKGLSLQICGHVYKICKERSEDSLTYKRKGKKIRALGRMNTWEGGEHLATEVVLDNHMIQGSWKERWI